MSATNAGFIRSSLFVLGLGCLLLVSLIGSTLWLTGKTRVTFGTVVEERVIRRASADLMQTLTDAETGQRGYLITRDVAFLTPYSQAIGDVTTEMDSLVHLLEPRPEHAPDVEKLRELVKAKLEELARTVELTRSGDIRQAYELVRAGYGKQLMDQIRTVLDEVRDESDNRIDQGIASQLLAIGWLQVFTIGGAVAIVIVIGGAILIIIQHVRDLLKARQEVEVLNAGLEERVQERTEDLMQANQEIQRFAYIITHDLRAPLVNIMGFTAELDSALQILKTYVLADGQPLTPQQIEDARLAASEDLPEAISFIRSSTRKMDGLINAILKISRDGRRQLKPEELDLKPLIETTAASVHHQISESGGHTEISTDVASIISDRLSLEQILGNLFDNAIKYKSPDRPVVLSIRAVSDGRHFIRLEIEDNGRGIAEQDHERIFELFRRSGQQNQVGEGIGLAHVRSLTRNLGGEITVRSKIGVGSTFILRLPRDLSKLVGT
ncbi:MULTISPECIES: sensor histidine kinase [Rhizobium/Agrobacterium group]|uniref:histidine kinase n=2 Tax=Rhizobium/Agrobacterium group TaxID=227290 RepID=B9JZF2_ALLAM|nr:MULTISPECIES: CHASE3 domain-containing protein [Rhizobium/Agrobacterium group]ACM35264.1 two component sensor kinase [Allorhizobium ampelinum S4]MBF2717393.1 CHASE3 domain-containing protein [Agrobacterium vitis]MCF1447178.1 histidine kinase [Allorhizobium ampelinum]MCF1493433.1 histidine kinase [Allorhizobium ampelinum]MUO28051.1 histidine kinase [Agrobacterium vitis]